VPENAKEQQETGGFLQKMFFGGENKAQN